MPFKHVLCYGTLNPDLIYYVDSLPTSGGDIRSTKYKIRPGGTAINCAENINNWSLMVSVGGNSLANDALGNYLLNYLDNLSINHDLINTNLKNTPTCSIFVEDNGERTIVSSGYKDSIWSNLNSLNRFDSLLIDRYSISYIRENLKDIKRNNNIFLVQAGYEEEIDYEIDFLVVSKNEIEVNEANKILENNLAKYILLTSSNLPARLLGKEGAIEIVPPDFNSIDSTGAGDCTAAYIAAFGNEEIIDVVKKACAAGAILAGTNELPSISKIQEISKLVEVNPR